MKRLVTGVAAAAALLGLTGCGAGGALAGFSPMYADSTGIAPALSHMEVANVRGRAGFLVREALDDELARKRDEAPLYRLAMSVKESRIARGLRIDNVANRYELTFKVTYALVDIKAGKTLTRGVVTSIVTYDSADQPYAAVSAHQDAQERNAEDAAQKLRLNLASYFKNPEAFGINAKKALARQSQGGTISDRMTAQDVTAPADKAEEMDEDPTLEESLSPTVGANNTADDGPILIPSR